MHTILLPVYHHYWVLHNCLQKQNTFSKSLHLSFPTALLGPPSGVGNPTSSEELHDPALGGGEGYIYTCIYLAMPPPRPQAWGSGQVSSGAQAHPGGRSQPRISCCPTPCRLVYWFFLIKEGMNPAGGESLCSEVPTMTNRSVIFLSLEDNCFSGWQVEAITPCKCPMTRILLHVEKFSVTIRD